MGCPHGIILKLGNANVACVAPVEPTEDPVDCVSSEWDSWGACSVSCGSGQKVRQRQITQMANQYGKPCGQHASMEVAQCSTEPCEAQDCVWGEWSQWSAPTCIGLCERHRQIAVHSQGSTGMPCEGSKIETKACQPDCEKPPEDCVLSAWEQWSQCDKECGGGQRYFFFLFFLKKKKIKLTLNLN